MINKNKVTADDSGDDSDESQSLLKNVEDENQNISSVLQEAAEAARRELSTERPPLSTIDLNALREQNSEPSQANQNKENEQEGGPKKRKLVDKDKQKRWTWDDEKVEALLYNLQCYKTDKSFEGVDFEADLILKGKFTQKLFFDICFDIGLTSRK